MVGRGGVGAIALVLIVSVSRLWGAEDRLRDEPSSLATQVHAIFQVKCVECHGPDLPRPKKGSATSSTSPESPPTPK